MQALMRWSTRAAPDQEADDARKIANTRDLLASLPASNGQGQLAVQRLTRSATPASTTRCQTIRPAQRGRELFDH
jgi:hypothetical protein